MLNIGRPSKYTVFAPISHLSIDSGKKTRVKIADNVYLTSNAKTIRELVPTKLRDRLGSINYDDLFKNKTLIFYEESTIQPFPPIPYLNSKISATLDFMTYTWLIEDNNMYTEMFYLLVEHASGVSEIHSNFTGTSFYRCNNKQTPVSLSIDLAKLIARYMENNEDSERRTMGGEISTNFTKNISRINIVILHVMNCRRQFDFAMKITNYCSAMEALVSTSQSELTHQVSERMAFLLSNVPATRLEYYINIKKAYSLRSKFVHGAVFKDKELESLVKSCEFCDWALRRCIQLVFDDDKFYEIINGQNRQLDLYMQDLIFGLKAPPSG